MEGFEIVPHPAGWASSLVYAPWRAAGVLHGFVGLPADFSASTLKQSLQDLFHHSGLRGIVIPEQEHGSAVREIDDGGSLASLQLRSEDPEPIHSPLRADAIVSWLSAAKQGGGPYAIGIRTADCVPIFLRGKGFSGLIHAGWRGIAAGVIQATLEVIARRVKFDQELQALIGPCAGAGLYQVGAEVQRAVGEAGVFRLNAQKEIFLDLAATCKKSLIAGWAGRISVRSCGICTISDLRFHSFRRSGPQCGRNLGFIEA